VCCCFFSLRNLADVDKDGKLKADEFILAMHLVDMAKMGQALPMALPSDLVPPSLRYCRKDCILLLAELYYIQNFGYECMNCLTMFFLHIYEPLGGS